jgi:hypothetical protein
VALPVFKQRLRTDYYGFGRCHIASLRAVSDSSYREYMQP